MSLDTIEATASIPEVVAQVAKVQPLWALLRVEDRARYMRRMAQAIIDELDELREAIAREQRRPRTEVATLELLAAIDALKWVAQDGARVLGGRSVGVHRSLFLTKRARIAYEPYGVVGVIGAGSAPFAQPLGQIAGALLAGNGVVFKPAPRARLTGERIARVLARAGLPEGLVRVVHGGADVGLELARAGRQAAVHRLARDRTGGGARVRLPREGGRRRAGGQGRDARARRRARRAGRGGCAVGGVRGGGTGARRGRAHLRRAGGERATARATRRGRARDRRRRPARGSGRADGPAGLHAPRRARARAGGGGCSAGRHPALRRTVGRRLLRAHGAHGRDARDAADARASRRSGARADDRRQRVRGDRARQRHPVRSRRVGVDRRSLPRAAHRA